MRRLVAGAVVRVLAFRMGRPPEVVRRGIRIALIRYSRRVRGERLVWMVGEMAPRLDHPPLFRERTGALRRGALVLALLAAACQPPPEPKERLRLVKTITTVGNTTTITCTLWTPSVLFDSAAAEAMGGCDDMEAEEDR